MLNIVCDSEVLPEDSDEVDEDHDLFSCVFPEHSETEETYGDAELPGKTGNVSETEPIYPGHRLPINISVLLISLYLNVFSVPVSHLSFLLWLLNLHFLPAHLAVISAYKFKTFLATRKSYSKSFAECVGVTLSTASCWSSHLQRRTMSSTEVPWVSVFRLTIWM